MKSSFGRGQKWLSFFLTLIMAAQGMAGMIPAGAAEECTHPSVTKNVTWQTCIYRGYDMVCESCGAGRKK